MNHVLWKVSIKTGLYGNAENHIRIKGVRIFTILLRKFQQKFGSEWYKIIGLENRKSLYGNLRFQID